MTVILSKIAVIGRASLIPGIQPVLVGNPPAECFVAHDYPAFIEDPRREFKVDVTDCTLFTVQHSASADTDITLRATAGAIFEQALQAISEVIVWNRTKDLVGTMTAFTRQIGRPDVKLALIEDEQDRCLGWRNPLLQPTREVAALMAGFLGNMIVENGPAYDPTSPLIRRVMSSIDLLNLSFYTEGFINAFSLLDDVTQQVLRAGMQKKGLDAPRQRAMLMAIKEERLKHFLTNLLPLCDWVSLETSDHALFSRLVDANRLRNKIMHGSVRLTRQEALEATDAVLDTIAWLRGNPFGVVIEEFPLLKVAEEEFVLISMDASTGEEATDKKKQ